VQPAPAPERARGKEKGEEERTAKQEKE